MLRIAKYFIALAIFLYLGTAQAQKPKVWIYTDMTDDRLPGKNKEGTINDPDDISAMAGYLLMSNHFDTLGIVVGSTHRLEHRDTPNQADWANRYFRTAYLADLPQLNARIGDYPQDIHFTQSCIKRTAERFDPSRSYPSLNDYSTVNDLFQEAKNESGIINVLCWGSLTEPAIFVKHCIENGFSDILKQVRFIAHWTNSSWWQGSMEHPEDVANCREDAVACAYLKAQALKGAIKYYECGAIGQHGIVSGSPKGVEYFDKFRLSNLGTIFVDGKFAHDSVDHSDAATYWTLLGTWGVSLDDIASDGTNHPAIEKSNSETYLNWSYKIHDELLRRSNAASKHN